MAPGGEVELRELTPRGRGGVSVLALRGAGALARVQELVPERTVAVGALQLVRLTRAGELLDEALVFARGPADVEVHLHGSPAIVARVSAELAPAAAASGRDAGSGAPGGEPLEDEALRLCGAAASEAAARVLLDQAQGALRAELERLLAVRDRPAGSEATLDAASRLDALLERGRVARALVRVPVVVLAGPTNAGKSTLFNLLVGHERVVVHPEAGTTRDAVVERCRIGAYAVDLVDTAGARSLPEAADPLQDLERRGQDVARALGATADLVVELRPAAAGPPARPGGERGGPLWAPGERGSAPRASVLSRADEAPPAGGGGPPRLSALEAPDAARATVEAVFLRALGLPREPWRPGAPVPFREEQLERLEALRRAGPAGARAGHWEAVAELLRVDPPICMAYLRSTLQSESRASDGGDREWR